MENLVLDPIKDYPFRSSLIKVARCGMCKHTRRVDCGVDGDLVISCTEGMPLIYPLITGEHTCTLYKYLPMIVPKIPKGKLMTFMGLIKVLKECEKCSNNLENYCDGLHWYPFKTKPICEFFRDKQFICRYAIPYFQYGTTMRNNYCRKNPKKRDGDHKRGWKWNCHEAHSTHAEYLKCYKPLNKEG